MAKGCEVEVSVGVRWIDPNWAVMFMALMSHSQRALGQLESGRADLALESLKAANEVGDMASMLVVDDREKTD